MTKEKAIKLLKEYRNCLFGILAEPIDMAIEALEQNESAEEWYKLFVEKLEQEPSGDAISRQAVFEQINCWIGSGEYRYTNATHYLMERVKHISPIKQEPPTGHWMRKTKVDGVYDIAGVKTWGIKCQCDRCDFTTIVVEDFGYYKYCPNCGCRMVEPQESEDKE